MPTLSKWMLRTALFYLMLGFSLGLLLMLAKIRWISPRVWILQPFHIECLQMGWLFHLALGTAYWIFPRIKRKRPRSSLAWAAFGLINVGIGFVCINMLGTGGEWLLLARLSEFFALLLFAVHLWPRIKSFGATTQK